MSEPPVGEKWGEFPPAERQAELKRMLEAWEQEQDHGDRPGPFAKVELSGADVYWLAAWGAGDRDVLAGKKAPNRWFFRLAHPVLHLEEANLGEAHLEGAYLREAHLEGANLAKAHLEGANLAKAHLEGAYLREAHLEGADLSEAHLEGANLSDGHLEGANLSDGHLEGADLDRADLGGASLGHAQLKGAKLRDAQLKGASLQCADLEGARLNNADLEGADLSWAQLTRQVDLREATFDAKTNLAGAVLDATLQVADVLWNGVSLIRVDWDQVPRLGDEAQASQSQSATRNPFTNKPQPRTSYERLMDYQAAARAYRQLAIALRSQGITEVADRFTYRALIMQRKTLWWQLRSGNVSKFGAYLFSLFLGGLTGYGFRLWRILAVYGLLVAGFALAYWSVGIQQPHDLSYWQALAVSITAFHGRVFPSPFTKDALDSAQIWVTAAEAICGLVIEGVFIAMLTQRFFNR